MTNTIAELDRSDPLAAYRQRFLLPENGIYLDGNSLGPVSIGAREQVMKTLDLEWRQQLIGAWNQSWIDLPARIGKQLAPILGVQDIEVTCADSVSVNLFKLLAAALALQPTRNELLTVSDLFPTDLYITEGLSHLVGPDRCRVVRTSMAQLPEKLNDQTAVLLLSHVNFRTGELYNLPEITRLAHEAGALVLWDLSHSVGVVPMQLHDAGADMATGCGYKFLNGGPGAPAFVYVHEKHHNQVQQPLSGWMGHQAPFDFSEHYVAAKGIDKFLAGTPAILSMASLNGALGEYASLNLNDVRAKSIALTDLFINLVRADEEINDWQIVEVPVRGSQVSLQHKNAFGLVQAMIHAGMVCDFRKPDLARFGFAPLYTRFQDVEQVVGVLQNIVQRQAYLLPEFNRRLKVT